MRDCGSTVAVVVGLGMGLLAGMGCGGRGAGPRGGDGAAGTTGATGAAGGAGGASGGELGGRGGTVGTGGSAGSAVSVGTAGTGAAGGGSGGGGSAVGGSAGGITGAAILTVPFQRPGQTVDLAIFFGDATQNAGTAVQIDLSAVSEVRFRLCVAGAPDPRNTFLQVSVKDGSVGSHVGAQIPLSDDVVASCPVMKDIAMPLAGGTLDRTRVASFSLTAGTSAAASSFASPTVINLDAVTVSGNAVGPYDFARNTVPLKLRDTQGVGATLRASAPDLSPTDSAAGVLVELPPFTETRLNFATFGISLGDPLDFSSAGTMINYRVCAVSAPQASALFLLHFLTDSRNKSAVTPMGPVNVSACPIISELGFAVSDHASNDNSVVDFARVNLLGFEIGSQGMTQDPSVFFIDSVKVTKDIAGPFDFTFNAQSLIMGYRPAATALEWTTVPPSAH